MTVQLHGREYLTANEAATQVGVSRQTLWRWQQDGGAPKGLRYRGKELLFSPEEVALLQEKAERVTPRERRTFREAYLDNNSSTRPLTEVREAMLRALQDQFGNPSSAHTRGRIAKDTLEDSREAVAALCGSDVNSVVFTSGGSEANSSVLLNLLTGSLPQINRIVTTRAEHSSVLECCRLLEENGFEISYVPIDSAGRISSESLKDLDIHSNTLVSIHWVNNETGTIQPVEQIGEFCRSQGALFHTDAAQAVGKLPVSMRDLPVDYLTCTAHKIHGPQGIGAVLSRPSLPTAKLIMSGNQEFGRRGGTENLPGISGFGTAAKTRLVTLRQAMSHCRSQRDFLERKLLDRHSNATVNGSVANRVCNTTNICFRGIDGQALVAQLDDKGVYVSQSSACTNMRPEPSHVLTAMGLSEEDAYSSLRISVSIDSEMEDVLFALDAIDSSLDSLSNIETKYAEEATDALRWS